ncbi:hypothetical protein PISMIDRAFT_13088 [Pisolithus microcarpus 441]|uniref:Uncharacterized protein n=1 Tax=Pisolithus microcarpus 441 TaxID=765257 RepID=A0A0C9ZD18_9AGAM|nr:hypothetical protein BKA83DRAFT_13088 [Pisolithus microcarpus]KIK20337.1 hypothetical protein PISMIDRAFT_13088 [Pisolithus microcarpus 441]
MSMQLKNHEGFNSTDDNASDGLSEDSGDIQDEESSVLNIRNWPTYSDVAKNALDAIKETHNVVPIPAYDLSGHLIKPRAYCTKLEGAWSSSISP